MSSNTQYRPAYAPRYGSGGWREREAMKEKQRKEFEQRRKEEEERARLAKTEVNFPTLSSVVTQPVKLGEDSFADKAAEWQVKDEIANIREQARQERLQDAEKRERIMKNGIYIMSRAAVHERPQFELPPVVEEKRNEPLIDRDGFVIVKPKKVRKEKRELTEAELAAKHDRQLDENEEDDELNGDLMESSYRRDHY